MVPVWYPLGQKSGNLVRRESGVNGSCRGLTGSLPDLSVCKSHLISVRSEVQLLPGPLRGLILAIAYPVARISFCDVAAVCPFRVPVGPEAVPLSSATSALRCADSFGC